MQLSRTGSQKMEEGEGKWTLGLEAGERGTKREGRNKRRRILSAQGLEGMGLHDG